jgi:hypothetical protein
MKPDPNAPTLAEVERKFEDTRRMLRAIEEEAWVKYALKVFKLVSRRNEGLSHSELEMKVAEMMEVSVEEVRRLLDLAGVQR